MRQKRERRTRREVLRPQKGKCGFCQDKTEPDYKDVDKLQRWVTERGKIVSRGRTGLCLKHQRRLAVAIKRARYLALLPFTAQPHFR